jgi:hypothetical protein
MGIQLRNPNPYDRDDFMREVASMNSCCDWCGQKRKRLFAYYMESPNYRRNSIKGEFCNLDCFRSHHG